MGTTRDLATFCSDLRWENIPEGVRSHVKKCILDTLCCGLYGSATPEGKTACSALGEMGLLKGPCAIFGTDLKTDCANAAMANGLMVESLTMDDFHQRSVVHPGAVCVPPAIAMAEMKGNIDGKSLLTAIVAGYETCIRVGLGVSASARIRGHHPVGICGPFGSAAVACKLLGLDEEGFLSALGNAGSQGAGLMSAQFGFMTQRLHAGRAAQSGILAAFLAKSGFRGTANILEAEYGGFCNTYSESSNLKRITEGLGTRFESSEVSLRVYSCAASVCTSVDATKNLLNQYEIKPEDIEAVTVTCNKSIALHCGWPYKPDTVISAQMNIPYGVAVTLLEGDAAPKQYTEQKVHDPKVVAMASKVEVVHSPILDQRAESHAYYVHVEITTRLGQKYATEAQWAKGTPANPVSKEDLVTKCSSLAGNIIGTKNMALLQECVFHLEELRDFKLLFGILGHGIWN